MQPLDVAVFGPIKAKWKSFCRQWRIDLEGQETNKANVPVALNSFIINPFMTNNIKSGFKKSRIFPFDADSIGYTKVVQELATSTAIDAPTTYLEQNLSNATLSASHIIFIESCIDPSNLEQFKKADDHLGWKGDLEYLQLYHFWKRVLSKTSKTITLSDDAQQNNENLSPSCNVETIAHVEIIDYNTAAVTEPETACFNLKTAKEIVNPIENVLIWPKQPVQMFKRKIERLLSVVTSETWQQIRKAKEQEKSKMEEEKLWKIQLATEKKLLKEKAKKERKDKKILKKKKKVVHEMVECEIELHSNVKNKMN